MPGLQWSLCLHAAGGSKFATQCNTAVQGPHSLLLCKSCILQGATRILTNLTIAKRAKIPALCSGPAQALEHVQERPEA